MFMVKEIEGEKISIIKDLLFANLLIFVDFNSE